MPVIRLSHLFGSHLRVRDAEPGKFGCVTQRAPVGMGEQLLLRSPDDRRRRERTNAYRERIASAQIENVIGAQRRFVDVDHCMVNLCRSVHGVME
nr:hypothetical protein [Burkholderia cepacia]